MLTSLGRAWVLSLLVLPVGCAAENPDDTDDSVGALERGGALPGGGASGNVVVPGPQGEFLATIHAEGNGCPEGTYLGAVSPDGQTFTILFSAYEARVGPGVPVDI